MGQERPLDQTPGGDVLAGVQFLLGPLAAHAGECGCQIALGSGDVVIGGTDVTEAGAGDGVLGLLLVYEALARAEQAPVLVVL